MKIIVLAALQFFLFSSAAEASIRRDTVIANGATFVDLRWTMNAWNTRSDCNTNGTMIQTHFSSGSQVTGVAYNWGGGDTIASFQSGIAAGIAGNKCTLSSSRRSGTYGVDCSGFVTRAWNLPTTHAGTGQLGGYSVSLPLGAPMRNADIFLRTAAGGLSGHTAMYRSAQSNGDPVVMESVAGFWRVVSRNATWTEFNGYTKKRHNDLQDAGFGSVDQSVSVSPSTVRRNQSITVSYRIRELQSGPITFDEVTAAILTSAGAFQFDVRKLPNITVSANGTYTYSQTATITLPAGTYRAVARGRLPNWFDFSTTGGASNSRTFTVIN